MKRSHRFLTGALLVVATACNPIAAGDAPTSARVTLESLSAPSRASLVTSTSFQIVTGGRIVLVEADTQVVELPLDRRFTLNEEARFFVAVGPAAEGEGPGVGMRVWIDEERWFDERRTIGADSLGVLTFVYRFRQAGL